jgi:hypothetical protein
MNLHYSKWRYLVYGGGGVLSLAIILGLVGVVSLRAVPGDFLYALKVNGVEESLEVLRFDPATRADYHLAVLDRRIAETEALAERAVGNQGDAEYLFRESLERARELVALLAENPDGAFSAAATLTYTHELVVRVRTQEAVAERSSTISPYAESLGEARRELGLLYDARAVEFVATTDTVGVRARLSEELQELLAVVTDTRLSTETERRVERAVRKAQSEIGTGMIAEALGTLGDARRAVAVGSRIGAQSPETAEVVSPSSATTTTEIVATTTGEDFRD